MCFYQFLQIVKIIGIDVFSLWIDCPFTLSYLRKSGNKFVLDSEILLYDIFSFPAHFDLASHKLLVVILVD